MVRLPQNLSGALKVLQLWVGVVVPFRPGAAWRLLGAALFAAPFLILALSHVDGVRRRWEVGPSVFCAAFREVRRASNCAPRDFAAPMQALSARKTLFALTRYKTFPKDVVVHRIQTQTTVLYLYA